MMTARPACYVASPLGFTEAGRHYYASVLLPALAAVVRVIDPWSLTPVDETSAGTRDRDRNVALEIGRRNEAALRDANLLVAVLDGQEVDPGTAAEIGFAAALGVKCYGLRTDLRDSGEPGATVNLQVEAFIEASGGQILPSLDRLIGALQSELSIGARASARA